MGRAGRSGGGRSVTACRVGVEEVEAQLAELVGLLEPEDRPCGRGRPRILPAMALWSGLLVCVARGFSSQLGLWRLLTQVGLWAYPRFAISDQAVYRRLARDGIAPLETLLHQLGAVLDARLAPLLPQLDPGLAPFATDVVALDETTLDPVARRLGSTEASAPPRRLPGKLAGLYDLRRQRWRTVRLSPDARQNERVLARELVDGLARGTLVLADLGYFGFAWFDELSARGLWWVSRLRAGTSYTLITVLAQHGQTMDAIIWLGKYRADRAASPVRLVQFEHQGVVRRYITNVTDPLQLPAADVARLYTRRWDIELAIALLKRELGVALWWSTKDVVIHQQLYAALIVAQVLQCLRLEVAARAEVDVFDVSLPLLVRYLPLFAAQGQDPIGTFLERGRAAGFIRPARRVVITTPDPPLVHAIALRPPPPARAPRHAQRNCGPRRKRN